MPMSIQRPGGSWPCDGLQATGDRPLSCLAFFLMQQQGLISGLQLDEHRLVNFLLAVEDLYGDHPYHNRPVCPSLDSTNMYLATQAAS